jgi:hypothetical protein
MDLVGFIPLAIGILYLVAAFADIEWIMKNKSSLLIKILGYKGVRGWLTLGGLFFIVAGLFLLIGC